MEDCNITDSKMIGKVDSTPFTSCKRVVINDFTLILTPRIKIDFSLLSGCKDWLHPSTLKYILNMIFRNPNLFPQPFMLPVDDIQVATLMPRERLATSDNYLTFAKGCFFFRFPYNISNERLMDIRTKLAKKLNGYDYTYCDVPYELRVFVDLREDANRMLADADLSHEPPAIIIKGLPLQWFIEQPDSSEPSEQLLHIFFESFGNVRTLDVDVSKDVISVQYNSFDDLQEALNSLCSYSLQKEETKERIEYSVMLKGNWEDDKGERHLVSVQPLKRLKTLNKVIHQVGAASLSSSSTHESFDIQPLPRLEVIFKELLQEEGVSDVRIIRRGFEDCVGSQDLQLWLSNAPPVDNHFTLFARVGKQVQEIQMTTTLDQEGINRALQRVFERV